MLSLLLENKVNHKFRGVSMARKGKMIEKEIESSYLDETMVLRIYQPEAFSPLYKYHLCIMQDGNDYYQLGRVATLSDRLHEEMEIDNTVFVGIHYQDSEDRRRKYHPEGAQHKAYKSFLIHEVVPFLDDYLPTYNMGYTRTLMGDSLAGTLALVTAFSYPHTFGKVIMQSPYIDETVLQFINNTQLDHPIDIYQTIGDKEHKAKLIDGSTIDLLSPNRELKELLKTKNVTLHYVELEDGEHTWKYWQKDMPNVFKTMFL